MFVWVLLEGLLQAVQALEAAGVDLMSAQAAAAAGPGRRGSSNRHCAEESKSAAAAVAHAGAQPVVQQHQRQQQQQVQKRNTAANHSWTALKELGKAVAMLPVFSNMAALAAMPFKAAADRWAGCSSSTSSAHTTPRKIYKATPGFKRQHQPAWQYLWPVRAVVAAAAAPLAVWSWLGRHRAAAAAFKFWLSLSLLMVLVLLLSAGAAGGVHPLVVRGVRSVPTHGVTAFVLAWHERVESTTIRVSVPLRCSQ
jgi:hypothetical protein